MLKLYPITLSILCNIAHNFIFITPAFIESYLAKIYLSFVFFKKILIFKNGYFIPRLFMGGH